MDVYMFVYTQLQKLPCLESSLVTDTQLRVGQWAPSIQNHDGGVAARAYGTVPNVDP